MRKYVWQIYQREYSTYVHVYEGRFVSQYMCAAPAPTTIHEFLLKNAADSPV